MHLTLVLEKGIPHFSHHVHQLPQNQGGMVSLMAGVIPKQSHLVT